MKKSKIQLVLFSSALLGVLLFNNGVIAQAETAGVATENVAEAPTAENEAPVNEAPQEVETEIATPEVPKEVVTEAPKEVTPEAPKEETPEVPETVKPEEQTAKASEEESSAKLDAAKAQAIANITTWKNEGKLTAAEYDEAVARILAQKNEGDVEIELVVIYELYVNPEKKLENAKKNALAQLDGWYQDGKLEKTQYDEGVALINSGTTVAEVQGNLKAIYEKYVAVNGVLTELEIAKNDALATLQNWHQDGLLTVAQYDEGVNLINSGTTIAEVQANLTAIYDTYIVVDKPATPLELAKDNALNTLSEWYQDGKITDEEYDFSIWLINEATTLMEVEQFMEYIYYSFIFEGTKPFVPVPFEPIVPVPAEPIVPIKPGVVKPVNTKVANKKMIVLKKKKATNLPATGETGASGLLAGSLLSMAAGYAIFFRRKY